MRENELLGVVGVVGVVSLAVLGVVGRRSYNRKIVQLTKELEKEGKKYEISSSGKPPKVWAVLSPQETVKVFTVPLFFVLSGASAVGFGLKSWYGIRDFQHGLETIKWIARVGPPPSKVN
jgi:hypothetical protein